MPLIELKDVSFHFSDQPILTNCQLTIETGERLVVMGSSGAGKTTLLRILAGLIQPSQGVVVMNGIPYKDSLPAQRHIALLTQDYALYPQLTIQQGLIAALKPLRISSSEILHRIDEVCKWFQLEGLLNRRPAELSGGQAQRAAFARAVVRRPRLLLLDEPLSQLDGSLRQELTAIVTDVAEAFQMTVCLVAHDCMEAFRIGTRLAVLEDGYIVQSGLPENLYNKPATPCIAELTSPFGINWIPLATPQLSRWASQNSVFSQMSLTQKLGIRPEQLTLNPSHAHASSFQVEGIVENCKALGFAHLIHVRLDGQRLSVLHWNGPISIGETVSLGSRTSDWIVQ